MSETRIESDHVTMPLTDHNNFVYIGIFYIGSPGGSDSECQGASFEKEAFVSGRSNIASE